MNGLPDYSVIDISGSVLSANYDIGRPSIIGALIHTTSGTNSIAWLTTGAATSGNPASADYLIARDGQIYKLGAPGRYPYHAGKSRFTIRGITYSGDELSSLLLGVEIEQVGSQIVTWQQNQALAQIIVKTGIDNSWRWSYYLLGHYEVAVPMGRRSDPQGFEWGDFMGQLLAYARASNVPGLG